VVGCSSVVVVLFVEEVVGCFPVVVVVLFVVVVVGCSSEVVVSILGVVVGCSLVVVVLHGDDVEVDSGHGGVHGSFFSSKVPKIP